MTHTPGPWTAEGKGGTHDGGSTRQHPCFLGKVLGANGQVIIQNGSFLGVQGATAEEAEDNAKLITSASELLKALKAIATPDFDDARCDFARWLQAHIAIEQATGKNFSHE